MLFYNMEWLLSAGIVSVLILIVSHLMRVTCRRNGVSVLEKELKDARARLQFMKETEKILSSVAECPEDEIHRCHAIEYIEKNPREAAKKVLRILGSDTQKLIKLSK